MVKRFESIMRAFVAPSFRQGSSAEWPHGYGVTNAFKTHLSDGSPQQRLPNNREANAFVAQAIACGATHVAINVDTQLWMDTDVIELGECLKLNTTVTSLQIYDAWTEIARQVWQMLGDVLRFNSTLTVIGISNKTVHIS